MLDVRRLRVLLAVAEHGGVSAAARALSFTSPAVSQQVSALERQLGVALLDRSRRAAGLTDAGRRLAAHARDVLARLEAAEADVIAGDGSLQGVLGVACVPTLGRTVLPAALRVLSGSAPGLEVTVTQAEPEEALPALRRGTVDVVLAGEFGLTPHRGLSDVERVDLFAEPVLVAVPADAPWPGPEVALADLDGARWIAPAEGSSCAVLLDRSCAVAGYEPRIAGRAADFDMAVALVGAGLGVALVPRLAAPVAALAGRDPHVRLLTPAAPAVHRTVYAALRAGSLTRPAVAALVDALREAAPGA